MLFTTEEISHYGGVFSEGKAFFPIRVYTSVYDPFTLVFASPAHNPFPDDNRYTLIDGEVYATFETLAKLCSVDDDMLLNTMAAGIGVTVAPIVNEEGRRFVLKFRERARRSPKIKPTPKAP
jgi:hypothetical protein